MSDAFENVPARPARERSLLKRLQGINRSDESDGAIPPSNGISGTGINLIAAVVGANADFSFANPASADEKIDGDHRDDGTVSTESAEGARAEQDGNRGGAEGGDGQGAVNGGSTGDEGQPGDTKSADKFAPGDAGGDHAAAQPNPFALDLDAMHKASAKHHGSSPSPNLIGLGPIGGTGAAADSASSNATSTAPLEVVSAVAVADSSGGSTFFVGNSDPGQIVSIIGAVEAASTTTVDFSGVKISAAPTAHFKAVVPDTSHISVDTTSHGTDSAPAVLKLNIESTHNGVYVDLGTPIEKVETDHGTVTVNAVSLDADGKIGHALAHIQHVDNVVGTVGNDIIVGNGHANTITYTASDDAQHATADGDGTGAGASYGFDIVSGGPDPFSGHAHEKASDSHDTLDLSHVGSQEGVKEAASHGQAAEVLPDDAKGVTVDLEQSITIETVNPHTGGTVEVTGTLVSTTGGSERTDLALIVWAAPAKETTPGEMIATIENIIGSHGADDISGNSKDNVYTVIGSGASGPSTFDGRGGSDTIDFSKLGLPNSGIEIHLSDNSSNSGSGSGSGSGSNQGTGVATEHSGTDSGPGTAIVIVANVENVVGSHGNDIIQGNSADNILTGISGCDTFIFKSTILLDGIEYANIGDDEITDYNNYSGHGTGGGHDSLWLNGIFFHFDNNMSASDKLNVLFDQYAHDDNGNTVIRIDSHNSIRLDNMSVSEARLYFADTFYFI